MSDETLVAPVSAVDVDEVFDFGLLGGLSGTLYYAVVFCLLCLMAGLGATMKPVDLVNVSRRPRGIIVGICSQFGE